MGQVTIGRGACVVVIHRAPTLTRPRRMLGSATHTPPIFTILPERQCGTTSSPLSSPHSPGLPSSGPRQLKGVASALVLSKDSYTSGETVSCALAMRAAGVRLPPSVYVGSQFLRTMLLIADVLEGF